MSSDYIKEAFKRVDLKRIRSFLLYGTDNFPEPSMPYTERLQTGSEAIYERLKSVYPNTDEMEIACFDLAQALGAYEEVYFEIGMKLGAKLIYQLLLTDDDLPTGKET